MKKILIISLGAIAKRHIRNLKEIDSDLQIGVLRRKEADVDPEVRKHIDEYFYNWEDALSWQPAGAVICSPASCHLEQILKLAQKQIPMVVEKPLSYNNSGLQQLLKLYREQPQLCIMVAYQFRFYTPLIEFKKRLHVGEIGRVISIDIEVGQYLPEWRPGREVSETVSASKELGGGVLLELSHEFDYLNYLFGMPTEVMSFHGTFGDMNIDVEDLAEVLLSYEDKIARVHVDMLQRSVSRKCKVIGTEGNLELDFIKQTITYFGGGYESVTEYPLCEYARMYKSEMELFLKFLDKEVEPQDYLSSAVEVMDLIEALRESALKKQVVCL